MTGEPGKMVPAFTLDAIRSVTDSGSFNAGLAYHRQRRVHLLRAVPGAVPAWTATVHGTHHYQVDLRRGVGGRPEGTCSCPAFADIGLWCKHLVAVAVTVMPTRVLVATRSDGAPLGPLPVVPRPRPLPPPPAKPAPSRAGVVSGGRAAASPPPPARVAAPPPSPLLASPRPGARPRPSVAAPSSLGRRLRRVPVRPAPTPAPSLPLSAPASIRFAMPPPPAISPREAAEHLLGRELLALFPTPVMPVARREILTVRYAIVPPSPAYGGNPSFAVSLRVGPKRLYVVARLKEFLDAVAGQKTYPFGARFTYDPGVYALSDEDARVLALLHESTSLESRLGTYGGYSPPRYGSYGQSAERYLSISPAFAGRLWPALEAAGAEIEWERDRPVPFVLHADPLPVEVRLSPGGAAGYTLDISGLDQLSTYPAYGLVRANGQLYTLEPADMVRLLQLRSVHWRGRASGPGDGEDAVRVGWTAAELESAMVDLVPYFRRVAHLTLAPEVFERMVDAPLSARIYVDREDETLTVRPEWRYGEVVLDAFAPADDAEPERRVVARDFEGERKVLDRLREVVDGPLAPTVRLDGDEAIYRFLHDGLPLLGEVAEVYVTDRVDALWPGERVRARARVELDAESHWLDVRFDLEGIEAAEVDAVLRSLVERRRYHRLRTGVLVDLATAAFADLSRLADDLALGAREIRDGAARLRPYKAAALGDGEGTGTGIRLGASLRRWLRDLSRPEEADVELPKGLAGELRDYQEHGFRWLKTLARYGFGGILADDMGLGKTIQAIAFLLSEREGGPFDAPALVLCPASLVYNWENELRRFAPSLRVEVVAGTIAEREAVFARASGTDVLITSYPLLRRDLDRYRSWRLHALILDEAQFVKNHYSKTAVAIQELESDRRFALTGTPVENSLDDLWSILRAVFPDLAGGHEAFARLEPEQVARRLRPFLLRRLKADVLTELPAKIETLASAELTLAQKKVYLAYLERIRAESARDMAALGFEKSRMKILAGLTRLRQVCCHPALFVEGYTGGSGKLDELLDLLDEGIGSGKRILVFSQFTSMLAIIRSAVEERGWSYFHLEGETPPRERLAMADAFNRGERPLFLISLKAGGTGLNLTGADTVILYDLWWNPAVEQQAVDRAHRIGQTNVVQVIRLITRGTVEDRIHALQEAKRDLIDRVVQASDGRLGALTEADVRDLLAL